MKVLSNLYEESQELNSEKFALSMFNIQFESNQLFKQNSLIFDPSTDTIPDTTSQTIELSDKRQIKRSTKTLILDATLIYDEIICISSVCCDLRFYDLTRAGNLRLYIRNFPSPLNAFHYFHYCDDDDENNDDEGGKKSRLLFGDFVGSVRLIEFSKNFKAQLRIGSTIRQISYHELMKVKKTFDAGLKGQTTKFI